MYKRQVLSWLLDSSRKTGLIVGGKLYDELRRSGFDSRENRMFHRTLKILSDAGRLHKFIGSDVRNKTAALKERNECKSDDPHVVALAIVSGCSIVFSFDKNLAKDLKNRTLIGHRVSIYKRETHRSLLKTCHCSQPMTE